MPEGSVDVITLIFVLSAVHPDKMTLVLQNISRVRLFRYVFVSFLCKAQMFLDLPDTLPFSPSLCVCVCKCHNKSTLVCVKAVERVLLAL